MILTGGWRMAPKKLNPILFLLLATTSVFLSLNCGGKIIDPLPCVRFFYFFRYEPGVGFEEPSRAWRIGHLDYITCQDHVEFFPYQQNIGYIDYHYYLLHTDKYGVHTKTFGIIKDSTSRPRYMEGVYSFPRLNRTIEGNTISGLGSDVYVVENMIFIPGTINKSQLVYLGITPGGKFACENDIIPGYSSFPLTFSNTSHLFLLSKETGEFSTWSPTTDSLTNHSGLNGFDLSKAFGVALGSDAFVLNVQMGNNCDIYSWNSQLDSWENSRNMSQVTIEPAVCIWGNDIVYAHNSSGNLIVESYSTISNTSTTLPSLPDAITRLPCSLGVYAGKFYLYSHPRLYWYDSSTGMWDYAKTSPSIGRRYLFEPVMVINDSEIWLIGM
jgi:hypothetical protein